MAKGRRPQEVKKKNPFGKLTQWHLPNFQQELKELAAGVHPGSPPGKLSAGSGIKFPTGVFWVCLEQAVFRSHNTAFLWQGERDLKKKSGPGSLTQSSKWAAHGWRCTRPIALFPNKSCGLLRQFEPAAPKGEWHPQQWWRRADRVNAKPAELLPAGLRWVGGMSPMPATALTPFSAYYDWTKAKRRRPGPSG